MGRVMRYGVMTPWGGLALWRYGVMELWTRERLMALWCYGVMAPMCAPIGNLAHRKSGMASVEARHRERRVAATNLSVLDQS